MLQFPWLLTGVVIVETLFNYKGFGWTLVAAAGNNDIELLLSCSVVAVFVVLVTQLISDIRLCVPEPAHPCEIGGRGYGAPIGPESFLSTCNGHSRLWLAFS